MRKIIKKGKEYNPNLKDFNGKRAGITKIGWGKPVWGIRIKKERSPGLLLLFVLFPFTVEEVNQLFRNNLDSFPDVVFVLEFLLNSPGLRGTSVFHLAILGVYFTGSQSIETCSPDL